jgi:AcrR family transcriptional regulator
MGEMSTKEKILKTARKMFVVDGFSGTSMGKIGKEAGVNHSLLFHHFENKENLWAAVKQDIIKDTEAQSKMLPDSKLPFKKFLRELMINSISFYRQNPDIIRMLNWQRLESKKDKKIGITLSAETQAWIDTFSEYQKKGHINTKLKPEFIVTFVLSIVSSLALDPNDFIRAQEDEEAYIDFCIDRVQKALE